MPFLRERADLPQSSNAITHLPGSDEPNYGVQVPVAQPSDHRPLLNDPEFRNILLQKRWIVDDVLYQYSELEPMVESLIDLVTEELSDGRGPM